MSQLTTEERLYKYEMYCSTEGETVVAWRPESDGYPTSCPNDPTHTYMGQSLKLVGWVDPALTVIKEEEQETGGNYMAETLEMDAGVNQVSSTSISYPFPVSVLATRFKSEEENRGDMLSLVIGKNTPIGTVSANTSVPVVYASVDTYQPGDNVSYSSAYYNCTATTTDNTPSTTSTFWDYGFKLPVSSTVTANTLTGYRLSAGAENLDRVVSVGSDHVVVETAPGSGLSSGAVVLQSVYKIKDYELGGKAEHEFGTSKIGASYLPAHTEITFEYNNTSLTTQKRIVGIVEYLH